MLCAVAWLAAAVAWGSVELLPPTSRERAEQLDEWRAILDQARRAAAAGRQADADALYREVLAEADRPGETSLLLARAIDGLGDLCVSQQRYDEAAGLYERSARMWQELFGDRQPRLATTLHNLGLVYMILDRPDEAELSLRRALTIWDQTLGADSSQARGTRELIERLETER